MKGRKRLAALLQCIRTDRQLYLFLLLPVIYVIVFHYVPMAGAQIAFRKFTVTGGIWGSKWIGLENFRKFINSFQFKRVLPNTVIVSLYTLIVNFPIPIFLALCINAMRSKRYSKVTQTILYVPYFISTVVIVGMIKQLFNTRTGLYGAVSQLFTGSFPVDILGKPGTFRHIYAWSGVWQYMGFNSIVYLAVLSSVSTELHEAAEIDGASRFQRLLHVDLPALIPTAIILLILNCGRVMSVGFEKVYLLQNNLNLRTSEVISTYVYKVGIAEGGGDFSYATAIDLMNSLVNLILLSTVNLVSKRLGETSIW